MLWRPTQVYLSRLRLTDGELLVVATDESILASILTYAKRWEIECLFACLKSKGFHFEDTHITKIDCIEKLLALLTIAFCWAYKTGEWEINKRQSKSRNMAVKR